MTERMLLGIFSSTFETIARQKFKDANHQEKMGRVHGKVTGKLIDIGRMGQIMQIKFGITTRLMEEWEGDNFAPYLVDKLDFDTIVGSIDDHGSRKRVDRRLLGRTHSLISGDNENILVREYYLSKGEEDYDLLRFGSSHQGLSNGQEVVVEKIIPRKEARLMAFTGVEESKEAREVILFPTAYGRESKVAA